MEWQVNSCRGSRHSVAISRFSHWHRKLSWLQITTPSCRRNHDWHEHSCVRSVWSHVTNPCHNGSCHYSGGALHPTSTRYPMSTQSRRKLQWVRLISHGPTFSTSKKLWYTGLHRLKQIPPISVKKRKSPRFVVAGKRLKTRSKRQASKDSVKTQREAEKALRQYSRWVDVSSANNASTKKGSYSDRFVSFGFVLPNLLSASALHSYIKRFALSRRRFLIPSPLSISVVLFFLVFRWLWPMFIRSSRFHSHEAYVSKVV